jgi:hypothetical protein
MTKYTRRKGSVKRQTTRRKRQMGGGDLDYYKLIRLNKYFHSANIAADNASDYSRYANVFNPGAIYHNIGEKRYIIGVTRALLKPQRNAAGAPETNTFTETIADDRHPYSIHHPWPHKWGGVGTDEPLFFVYELDEPHRTRFFKMNIMIATTNAGVTEPTTYLEDPRIAYVPFGDAPGGAIYIFTAHRGGFNNETKNPKWGRDRAKPVPAGTPGDVTFELGPKKKKPGSAVLEDDIHQKPVLSWISAEDLNNFILTNFITAAGALVVKNNNKLGNRTWRPICANFLTNDTDKNFGLMVRPDKNAVDILYSIGGYTKSVVVFRYYVADIIKPAVPASTGTFDWDSHAKCEYTQSLGGLSIRRSVIDGHPAGTVFKSDKYDITTNGRITKMGKKLDRWASIIISAYVRNLASVAPTVNRIQVPQHCRTDGADTAFFGVELNPVNRSEFRVIVPVYYSVERLPTGAIRTKGWESLYKHPKIGDDYLNSAAAGVLARAYKFVNGISTGGTLCKRLGDEDKKFLGIGHLKLFWPMCYILYAASNDYQTNANAFQTYFDSDSVPTGAGLSADEKNHITYFMSFISNTDNIVKKAYNFIKKNEITNVRYWLGICRAAPSTAICPSPAGYGALAYPRGSVKNQIPIHYQLTYTTFLYSIDKKNYAITKISRQFLFQTNNTAVGPRSPILQFCHSIDVKDDKYLVGFGDNDAQSYLARFTKDQLHKVLEPAKGILDGVAWEGQSQIFDTKAETEGLYFDLLKNFLSVDIFKFPAPANLDI